MDLGNPIICDDQNDISVSDNSHTCVGGDNRQIWLTLAVGFGGCGLGCGTAKVLVRVLKGGFDLSCPFRLMKAVATTASFRHFHQPWFNRWQRVHRFSVFRFATKSSGILLCASFQLVCLSLELSFEFVVWIGVVQTAFQREVKSFHCLSV